MTVNELIEHLMMRVRENPDMGNMEVKVIDCIGYFGSIDAESIEIDEMECEGKIERYVFITS